MPDWLLYALFLATVAGLGTLAVHAVLLAVVLVRGAVRLVKHLARPRYVGPVPYEGPVPLETFVRVACHTARCGHLQRRHDVTDRGLVCRRCGHAVRPA